MSAAAASVIRPSTSVSRARWLAWSSVVVYVLLAGMSLALDLRFVGSVGLLDIWAGIAILGCAVVGALIVSTHGAHPIGWMFCGAALTLGFSSFAVQYAILALVVTPGTLPFGQAMAWFGFWAEMPAIAVLALFLPLLFPDGHLASRCARSVAYVVSVGVVLAVLIRMVAPAIYALAG